MVPTTSRAFVLVQDVSLNCPWFHGKLVEDQLGLNYLPSSYHGDRSIRACRLMSLIIADLEQLQAQHPDWQQKVQLR